MNKKSNINTENLNMKLDMDADKKNKYSDYIKKRKYIVPEFLSAEFFVKKDGYEIKKRRVASEYASYYSLSDFFQNGDKKKKKICRNEKIKQKCESIW